MLLLYLYYYSEVWLSILLYPMSSQSQYDTNTSAIQVRCEVIHEIQHSIIVIVHDLAFCKLILYTEMETICSVRVVPPLTTRRHTCDAGSFGNPVDSYMPSRSLVSWTMGQELCKNEMAFISILLSVCILVMLAISSVILF